MSLQKDNRAPLKPRTCKVKSPIGVVCGETFIPRSSLQVVCSPMCAVYKTAQDKSKKSAKVASEQRVAHRKAKVAAKTRSQWVKEAQASVNAYCRARDMKAGHGCIDCGKPFEPQNPGGSVDAGHYLSRGSHPNLKFNELNIHAQRKNCNRPGGATAAAFRLGMIARIGLEAVEELESSHEPKHYTIDDLKEIKAEYRLKLKELSQ